VANRASQPIIRTHGFIAQTKILTNKVKKPATFLKASDKDQNND